MAQAANCVFRVSPVCDGPTRLSRFATTLHNRSGLELAGCIPLCLSPGPPLVAWPIAWRRQGGPQLALPYCPQRARPLPACGRQGLQPLAAVCVREHQACQPSWVPPAALRTVTRPQSASQAGALVKRPPVESIHSDPRDPLFRAH